MIFLAKLTFILLFSLSHFNATAQTTYIEAEWRFERPESWLHFDGILSSIGEINPSASSSSCSRKQCALQSVFSVTVKSGLVELSSSDASSCS